jgi:hypothetical protein
MAVLLILSLPASAGAADSVQLTVSVDVVPNRATLSAGDIKTFVAYRVAFTNDNKSTLTQTRLRIGKPSITGSTATATYVAAYPSNLGSQCQAGSGQLAVDCQFGQVKPGKSISLTFVFQLPGHGAVDLPAQLAFAAADTILTIKEGVNDSGANQDTWYAASRQEVTLEDVPLESGGEELAFFATYTLPGGGIWGTNGTNIEHPINLQQLSATNNQATKVTVPSTPQGTVTIIKEIAPGNFGCPEADACFGDVSEVTVPDANGKTILIFVRWNESVLPSGMTERKLRVAWDPDDEGPLAARIVSTACNSKYTNTPCRDATVRFGDKDLGVLLALPHNGRIRGM